MLIVSGAVGILFAPREKGEDLAEGSGRFTRDPATAGERKLRRAVPD